MSAWTAEREAELTRLWPTGMPVGQIAERLGGGLSRAAVIAKADRMNLGLHATARRSQWAPGPSMAELAASVSAEFGVTVDALKGEGRRRRETEPRQAFMHRAYRTGRWSLPQIGRFLGGRDHTTVLSGVRAHERRAG